MKADLSEHTSTTAPIADGTGRAHPDTNTRLAWLRTQLAVERTLMAWNRTSLSLIGFGFTIYEFLKKVQEATAGSSALRPESPRNFGLAFLVIGTLGTLIALYQHHLYTSYLSGPELQDVAIPEGMPRSSLPLAITVFLSVVGIVTITWVVLGG